MAKIIPVTPPLPALGHEFSDRAIKSSKRMIDKYGNDVFLIPSGAPYSPTGIPSNDEVDSIDSIDLDEEPGMGGKPISDKTLFGPYSIPDFDNIYIEVGFDDTSGKYGGYVRCDAFDKATQAKWGKIKMIINPGRVIVDDPTTDPDPGVNLTRGTDVHPVTDTTVIFQGIRKGNNVADFSFPIRIQTPRAVHHIHVPPAYDPAKPRFPKPAPGTDDHWKIIHGVKSNAYIKNAMVKIGDTEMYIEADPMPGVTIEAKIENDGNNADHPKAYLDGNNANHFKSKAFIDHTYFYVVELIPTVGGVKKDSIKFLVKAAAPHEATQDANNKIGPDDIKKLQNPPVTITVPVAPLEWDKPLPPATMTLNVGDKWTPSIPQAHGGKGTIHYSHSPATVDTQSARTVEVVYKATDENTPPSVIEFKQDVHVKPAAAHLTPPAFIPHLTSTVTNKPGELFLSWTHPSNVSGWGTGHTKQYELTYNGHTVLLDQAKTQTTIQVPYKQQTIKIRLKTEDGTGPWSNEITMLPKPSTTSTDVKYQARAVFEQVELVEVIPGVIGSSDNICWLYTEVDNIQTDWHIEMFGNVCQIMSVSKISAQNKHILYRIETRCSRLNQNSTMGQINP